MCFCFMQLRPQASPSGWQKFCILKAPKNGPPQYYPPRCVPLFTAFPYQGEPITKEVESQHFTQSTSLAKNGLTPMGDIKFLLCISHISKLHNCNLGGNKSDSGECIWLWWMDGVMNIIITEILTKKPDRVQNAKKDTSKSFRRIC